MMSYRPILDYLRSQQKALEYPKMRQYDFTIFSTEESAKLVRLRDRVILNRQVIIDLELECYVIDRARQYDCGDTIRGFILENLPTHELGRLKLLSQ